MSITHGHLTMGEGVYVCMCVCVGGGGIGWGTKREVGEKK